MTKMIKGYKHKRDSPGLGSRFLMDFGFVRGPLVKGETKGKIMTSFNGYSS